MKAYIVDIDGTLANIDHRLHHVQNGNRNWGAFFDAIPDDTPYEHTIKLAKSLYHGDLYGKTVVLLVSGRPDSHRIQTKSWLEQQGVQYAQLYMRKEGDYRPDYIVKKEILVQIREEGWKVTCAIDDRDQVIDMWRREGIPVFKHIVGEESLIEPSGGILTLMVGPSGAGKTSWLNTTVTKYADQIVSTDELREQISGDFKDQTQNNKVFAAAHDIVATRLKHGLNVVVDATNLHRKDRLKFVELAHGGQVEYYVMDRPLEDKLRDGGWRLNVIMKDGSNLIENHHHRFKNALPNILKGDDQPNVTVFDRRIK